MSAQPEALVLADAICDYRRYGHESEEVAKRRRIKADAEAADELRRLVALVETLEVRASMQFDELNAIKARNAELLAALKLFALHIGNDEKQARAEFGNFAVDAELSRRAAITKAEAK